MTKLHAPQPIFMKRKILCALLPWSVSLSNCTSRLYLRSKDTLALRLPDALVSNGTQLITQLIFLFPVPCSLFRCSLSQRVNLILFDYLI